MTIWNLKETLNLTMKKMKTKHKAEIYNSPFIDELLQGISPAELERTNKRMLLAASIDDGVKAKGWKKKDFASAMGKTPSEITKWLSGTHNFTADTLFDIERILNINLFQSLKKPLEVINTYIYSVTVQSSGSRDYCYPMDFYESLVASYKTSSQTKSKYSH